MINQFVYNGKRSYDDLGLIITESPRFVYPGRSMELTSVMGRDGDVLTDNGCFENVTVEYKVSLINRNSQYIEKKLQNIAICLLNIPKYNILSDTYSPGYFRYAVYTGNISFSNLLQRMGTATLRFSCKPYKYRNDGRSLRVIRTQELINPEPIASSPYIKITGTGDITLQINNSSFFVEDVDEYIEIDSDLMAAFKETQLQNNKISFTEFPKFEPYTNSITYIGNVSKIETIPRWRTL